MLGIQLFIVYCRRSFNDLKRVIADRYRFRFSHRDVRAFDQVLDRIGHFTGLFAVREGNFISFKRQRYRVRRLVGTIAGNGDRLFGHFLTNGKVRVADSFVRCNRSTVLIHVMDHVAQGVHRPLGVNRSVGCDLSIPVIECIAVRRGKPTVEGIARLGGILRLRCSLILGKRLSLCSGCTAVHHKVNREGRRVPLRIERQVVARHLIEGVGILQRRVRIPSAPRVVTVIDRGGVGRFRRSVIIFRSVDIRVEIDIALRR